MLPIVEWRLRVLFRFAQRTTARYAVAWSSNVERPSRSSRFRVWELVSVDCAGEVALEDASDLAVGLALGASPVDVGAGVGVVDHSDHRDDVQRSVELPVSAAERLHRAVTARSRRLQTRATPCIVKSLIAGYLRVVAGARRSARRRCTGVS